MKKSIIAVLVLLSIVALLPIIGNSYMQSTLDERINELNPYGLVASTDETDSSYLSTLRHLEFELKDSQKFVEYLNQFSSQQLPAYVGALLRDVTVGLDVKYSNLPFVKAVEIEVYPLTLSPDMMHSVEKDDKALTKYINDFLAAKGVLYHLNYNIVNADFDGYIKDIDEHYKFDANQSVDVTLSDASFTGNGKLIAPEAIKLKIKEMKLHVLNNGSRVDMTFEGFKSKSKFTSKYAYASDVEFDTFTLQTEGLENDIQANVKDFEVEAYADDAKQKAKLGSKMKMSALAITTKAITLDMQKLKMDIKAKDVDKASYIELQDIISNNNITRSPSYSQDMQKSLLSLLSKGFVIDVKEFSLKNVSLEKGKNLNGFTVSSEIVLKEDPDLAKKVQMSPLMAMGNVEVDTKVRVAKTFYNRFANNSGAAQQIQAYVKEDGDDYIYDIIFKDSKITINGKALN